MRHALIVLWTLLWAASSAVAQLSIGIAIPGMSIGINVPTYPEFVQVPGYPVYYAPRVRANYFFYDGMYWVYQEDDWYASSWYNGPWGRVSPEVIPLFVLRIPVRYYRAAPAYFGRWQADAPPRWGEHWGGDWEQHRRGWDQWNRRAAPAPAPLPVYQRQYSHDRYPQAEQQRSLHGQSYRYQPREAIVRQHYEAGRQGAAPQRRQPDAQDEGGRRRESERPSAMRGANQPQGPERQKGADADDRRQEKGASQQGQERRENKREGNERGKDATQEQEQNRGRDKGKDSDRGR